MFSLCENMKWNHLPLAGGIYKQHPDLIARFRIIFAERAAHEQREQKKREAENNRKSRAGRIAGRRHR